MSSPLPVDPTLDASGALAALVPYVGEQGAKPVPLDPNDDVLKGNFDVVYDDLSVSLAASLSLSPIFSGQASGASRAIYFDAMTHVPKPAAGSSATPGITQTYWGVGLRICLLVSTFDAKMKGGIGIVAASADLGLTSVKYHVQGLGLGVQGLAWVLSGFPAFGSFDAEAYAQIKNNVIAKLAKFLTDNAKTLSPQAYAVELNTDIKATNVEAARPILFAMQRIKDGVSFDDALKRAGTTFDSATIRAVYDSYAASTPDDQGPPKWARQRADDWLSV